MNKNASQCSIYHYLATSIYIRNACAKNEAVALHTENGALSIAAKHIPFIVVPIKACI